MPDDLAPFYVAQIRRMDDEIAALQIARDYWVGRLWVEGAGEKSRRS